MNYYNEFDPKTAAWLRQLIKDDLIPNGHVDERSITEVSPDDLSGYTQCHFFAGVGGWSYALQLAGWPENRPVWTGSCPCQPFSGGGKQLGAGDSRHLWPVFFALIKKCQPEHVFGEQVARAVGFQWLDGICADLEGEDYSVGAAVLGAHSVKSPQVRQRLYWVANSGYMRGRNRPKPEGSQLHEAAGRSEGVVRVDNSQCQRLEGLSHSRGAGEGDGERWRESEPSKAGCWDDSIEVMCGDGKARRIPFEPSFFPMAHGIPESVVRLRGYGNAIVPQVAAEFISGYLDCQPF